MTGTLGPDRAFALTLAPRAIRPALAALWVLDERLGGIVATTIQPMAGQMRLTWWHEALTGLRQGTTWGEPVLDALAEHVGGAALDAMSLAGLVEGWEVLLDPMPLDAEPLQHYANARGGLLFALSASLLGGLTDDAAGKGWALADFAFRCSDATMAMRARTMAMEAFAAARIGNLPRPLRVLARLAAGDVHRGGRTPRTIWRLLASIR